MQRSCHSPRRSGLIAVVVIGLAAGRTTPAMAEPPAPSERADSRVDVGFGLENRRFDEAEVGADSIWSGAITARGLAGRASMGFDATLGGGPGLFYGARVLVGAGVPLPGNGRVALRTGLGASGLTGGRIGFGFDVPLELEVTLSLGGRVRPTLLVRPAVILSDAARQDGTRFGGVDELEATLALAVVGKARGEVASGFYVGASYGERLGGRELGLVIGMKADSLSSPASRERERLARVEAERRKVEAAVALTRAVDASTYVPASPGTGTTPGWNGPAAPVDATPATIGLIDNDDGIQMVIIIFGEVDKYEAAGSNALNCTGERDGSSGWVFRGQVTGVEAARESARAIDGRTSKVGSHYEIWIKNGQCGYATLVR